MKCIAMVSADTQQPNGGANRRLRNLAGKEY